jgi:putative transcriptional regulator
MYKPITVDRENLTLLGVTFSDLETLNSVANAVGSNMFEGFEPTPQHIELYRDFREKKISIEQLVPMIKKINEKRV